ncbi:PREDICTED: testis-specific serine/threonine-protein kinase 2 [Apaloderma vittatum]|uniref:testis-specific serine/threonine-protein kinase 2 n=1 Tax=Apaloderma vittatum TaxID=57397 RepID=UPI000521421F|nr:PREDICTED: testis-specific serine/threonine-protein kinase 2 [Apaloderma vittatum]
MDDAAALRNKGYSLSDTLGEGSYGKVKRAYCSRLKCSVAIKIINKRKAPTEFLERFLPREIEASKRLEHPSIIKTYEIFTTAAKKVYIVMELGEKGDLLNYINMTGPMKEEMARVKFQQLASAIKYCHDLDVVHRDLKCENILLDVDLNIKLSDFGFCKFLSRDEHGRIILSETFCGSVAYAAPEVLQGIPCDPRISDIWSLGVILYTMVCALMPFDDSHVKTMIHLQKQQRIPFPDTICLTLECKNLIYHLLQPSVSQRPCIDEVLKDSWLQTPKSKMPSAVPAAEDDECSQNLHEGKPEHEQEAKPHSAEKEGQEKEMGSS